MDEALENLESQSIRKKELLEFLDTLPAQIMIECTKQINTNDVAFTCLDCSNDPNFVQCRDCFYKSSHEKHLWYCRQSTFGECDCGDETTIKIGCSCSDHSYERRLFVEQKEFLELAGMAKFILESMEKDMLAFDVPMNPHLLDVLAICSIYGRSSLKTAELFELYKNPINVPLIDDDQARSSFFGVFALKPQHSKQINMFYGSVMPSNKYFRIHASEVVSALAEELLDIKNVGFHNALVEVLNEPAGIIHFGETHFFTRISIIITNYLSHQIAKDKAHVIEHYIDQFEIFEQYCFFRTSLADLGIIRSSNLEFLEQLVGLHEMLIDAYELSTVETYEETHNFNVSWFNFTSLFVLVIFKMSRFILSLNIPLDMTFDQICQYNNTYAKRYCATQFEREYFATLFATRDVESSNGNFPIICEYFDALYVANVLYYSEISIKQLLVTWNIEISPDIAIEVLIGPIINFFALRLKIEAGDIQKQNLYEFEAIIQEQDELVYFNEVTAEQLFALRILLQNHSSPMGFCRRYFSTISYFIEFLHEFLFFPEHTNDDYMKCILTTTGNFPLNDDITEAVLNSTELSPQEILQMGHEIISREPIIMGDDKTVHNNLFYEYSVNLGLFDDILMQIFHRKENIINHRFCKLAYPEVIFLLPAELLIELSNYQSDGIEYSLELIIYRILKTSGFKDCSLPQFLSHKYDIESDCITSTPTQSLFERKQTLLNRLGGETSNVLLLGQMLQHEGNSLEMCQICHESDAEVGYFPCFHDQKLGILNFCNHVFHKDCLESVKESDFGACPLCGESFNEVEQNLDAEEMALCEEELAALLELKLKNHINCAELAGELNLLSRHAKHPLATQIDNFSTFFQTDTQEYIKLCATNRICKICGRQIEQFTLECPQCLRIFHGGCCDVIGNLVYCKCGHLGVFCIERLQYVLSPFLVYPVPYKDNIGRMTNTLFHFVKYMDYDSLEKFRLLVIRRTPERLSKPTFEVYFTLFGISQQTIEEYSTLMMRLKLLDLQEFLEAESEDDPGET